MSKRDGCRQSCCRVPFDGVCAKQLNCGCHSDLIRDAVRLAHAIDLELDRATTLNRKGIR